jgi:serine protease Do
MAIAIGNALGYGQSVTVGYVSALNREVTLEDKTMKLLQTDAAINPGNSGGALLNSKGEVIGINSVKYVDSSVESIGYAIPISDAIPIINELMNRTSIDEKDMAYLGIAGNDVTEAYSKGFGMPIGIYVEKVAENSAAQKAGLQVGDIIVSINNTPVKTMADLQENLGFIKAGSTGTITVKSLNNGKYVDRTLDVTFDTKPVNK